MRWVIVLSLAALAGCRVCSGACKAEHGPVVTAVAPNSDGTIRVTTCKLTTKGQSGTVSACSDKVLAPPN